MDVNDISDQRQRPATDGVEIQLLATRPDFVEAVTDLRWREWGRPPEPTERSWWRDATVREAGAERLPVTWVASKDNDVLGAVGLGTFDIEERHDRSPWVLGMVVRPDTRGLGIGRLLLQRLVEWAAEHEHDTVWVATGGPAVDFYRSCGWANHERIDRKTQPNVTVLQKRPAPSQQ